MKIDEKMFDLRIKNFEKNLITQYSANKALGKIRGFVNRHARPEERKEIAEAIDHLQGLINLMEER